MSRRGPTAPLVQALSAAGLIGASSLALAGAYISSSGTFPDRITHPSGYTGTGGTLNVSVCIAPTSESIADMEVSVRNAIFNWNQLTPVSPNLFLGGANDIPSGQIDFESTVVHEIGHCIGLAHPNAATESGLPNEDRNYTKAGQGSNGVFDLDPGADGIKGSADDLRGDDISLHWFNPDNNPFVLFEPVDVSNYFIDLADLPAGDTFPANADRTVGAALGFPDSEAVMQQGAFFDEDQRQLGVSDVAMIRLAASGLDETQGTGDDYTLQLVYGGVQSGCDITVQVTGGSFAFCSVGTTTVSGRHRRVTAATVQMGSATNFDWFFNQTLLGPEGIFADGFEI
ncbi:hypothetical protein HFP89_06580 [Wenzhouxiangella sp. XN79A]|uniref:hypothetical protein n=1 Tax=Wenzhouxiangella sp. XN79A TaxID=2724193 RepID=UPI00144A7189|nr:hypothetical protein [Wenzhouxiangella sp. XN79A]NKI34828.1 hypothetical protein [Wenzhouxiangella sp. XN79A]